MPRDLRNRSATGFKERIMPEDLPHELDHLHRYLFAAAWVPGRSVVDLCCGVGYGSSILAGAGARSILGIDIDAEVVAEANRFYQDPRIQFRCGDVCTPLPTQPAEVVVCFEGLEHVPRPEHLMDHLVQSLCQSGTAVISTPNKRGGVAHSGNPYHHREYTLSDFRQLLRPYFAHVSIYFQWGSRDPYDFRWSFGNLARAIVPIPVKRFFSIRPTSSQLGPSPSNHGADSMQEESPLRYRPYALAYLNHLPGLWHAQPSIWIAVCSGPRKPNAGLNGST
jgi:SAM-dependent methyltransferase